MARVLAFVRATWLTATSYRMAMVFSLVGLVGTFVPVYFVSGALQPVVADSIRNEGGQYFGFLVLGLMAMTLALAAMNAFPGRLRSAISTGTLEAILATPTSVPQLIAGMIGYDLLWAGFRSGLLFVAAWAIGMPVTWTLLPAGALLLLLVIVAYLAVGIVAAAAVLVFRTPGPLIPAAVAVTSLLGGVYYSTGVIPSWIRTLSTAVPMTYGLRAVRRLVLEGVPLSFVARDAAMMTGFAVAMIAASAVLFTLALRHARRVGTLAQY